MCRLAVKGPLLLLMPLLLPPPLPLLLYICIHGNGFFG